MRDIIIHPGEILLDQFLEPMGITQYQLSKAINVPQIRISEIVRGKRAISADTALRLGRFFGVEPQFWMNLQGRYELEKAEDELAERLDKEVAVYVA
jgi:antitoxin HigA-1